MRSRRLTVVVVAALLACPAAEVPAQLAPSPVAPGPSTPAVASLRMGALLPLTGPGAWFGAEIKQGLDLAAAELNPTPKRGEVTSETGRAAFGPADRKESRDETGPRSTTSAPAAGRGAAPQSAGTPTTATPSAESVEPSDQRREVALVVQTANVQPLDVKDAETEFTKLLGSGVVAIVTASPTPTLTVYPLASGRDVLVLHAGLATERFPATSRTLLQLRPSVAARADVLGAHAWERGIRRLAVLTGGDTFGRAVRAAVSARWRQRGGHLAHEETVSLDASDLPSRLHAVARLGPEAVVLGYQGAELGQAARALRDAGFAGQILAADDDRGALLAGGRALDGALIMSDAFVPIPGTRGARFARAYEAHYGQAPSRFAASAYEAATLLATAGERVILNGRSLTGSRLRDILVTERRFPSLYAGELIVRDDGTIGRPLALFRVDRDRLAFETYVGVDGAALPPPQESTP
jgi:ABC-type branched-subunit amino acid transport system substrate-binding protein